jgi:hypothetical protein
LFVLIWLFKGWKRAVSIGLQPFRLNEKNWKRCLAPPSIPHHDSFMFMLICLHCCYAVHYTQTYRKEADKLLVRKADLESQLGVMMDKLKVMYLKWIKNVLSFCVSSICPISYLLIYTVFGLGV